MGDWLVKRYCGTELTTRFENWPTLRAGQFTTSDKLHTLTNSMSFNLASFNVNGHCSVTVPWPWGGAHAMTQERKYRHTCAFWELPNPKKSGFIAALLAFRYRTDHTDCKWISNNRRSICDTCFVTLSRNVLLYCLHLMETKWCCALTDLRHLCGCEKWYCATVLSTGFKNQPTFRIGRSTTRFFTFALTYGSRAQLTCFVQTYFISVQRTLVAILFTLQIGRPASHDFLLNASLCCCIATLLNLRASLLATCVLNLKAIL